MTRLRAVLFDLDGTLLDSAPDIRQAVNKMLAEVGREPLSLAEVKSMLGDGVMETCRKALEATGGVKEGEDIYPYVQKFIAHYRSLPPSEEQVFPHVRETLTELKGAGVKLAVCTNKQEEATKRILAALGLDTFFDFIAGGDTFTVHKPNPGHILETLKKMDVAGTSGVVFVGDGPNDTVASARAGIPCFVVMHGYNEDYDALKADVKIGDISEIIPRLSLMGLEWE